MGAGGDRRRGLRLAALAGVVMAFAASAAPPPTAAAAVESSKSGDEALAIELGQRAGELYKCVGPYMQSLGGAKVAARIHAAGRYPSLVVAASSVLGSSHLTVLSARDNPAGSAGQTQSLIVALGLFASEEGGTVRQDLLRAKAVAVVASEIAGVSDGRCQTAPELAAAMARVAPEP
ncbi:hypothetical protein LVB77_07715 [Lysobacter sp. 5GHs7-4]|uniref:hypothetical protein n=1 Tax=Lysobacter sp. 5GHs7-4 TaxID=2904253 RepID=UPI001E2F49B9|nr:hypothetical protein [Lysobacter sp. 5GHs7-4]UHQ24561.1 hypothetical protein LVB77_07715 [Lysobacter sp. 5GHs7-4]